ncbi:glycosyl hydrolases family 31-domain-containing protein [Obelidium mucronatum]|nr:glycosyl hydrolases family 31-domain-containing protein [Obelidium mucronatum]
MPPSAAGTARILFCLAACASSVAAIAASNIVSFIELTPHIFTITTQTTTSTLSLIQPDIIRLQTSLKQFPPNSATSAIIDNPPPFDSTDDNEYELSETSTSYTLTGPVFAIIINKNPFKFGIHEKNNGQVVLQELWPTDIDPATATTTQYLIQQSDVQNYGGGIQTNGYINQRNKTLQIAHTSTSSNPSPIFYTTSNYAILRNTFSPGIYKLQSTIAAQHNESQYDAYILLDTTTSHSLPPLLNTYTRLTGRSFLPPMAAFGVGDSDCYQDPAELVATIEKYSNLDLPLHYIIGHDGCASAPSTLSTLASYLQTINSTYHNTTTKVGITQPLSEALSGFLHLIPSTTNIRRIDTTNGTFQTVLQACDAIQDSIESHKSHRAAVIGVKGGWAGIQRCGVVSTGVQTGSWENIKEQIPAIQTAGLSGFSMVVSDVDGINMGTDGPEAYIRDLQFKVFTPILSIRGSNHKRPWSYGEPFTTVARKYLKLRQSLMPHLYTLARESTKTGGPMVRPMSYEFPELAPFSQQTPTIQYQFMSGRSLLIAPVYTNSTLRENIYLPNGTWFDFWSGSTLQGPKTLPAYHAALDTIPIFARSPSIIPQLIAPSSLPKNTPYIPNPLQDPLQLSVFISKGQMHHYTLYQDDLTTQAFKSSKPVGDDGSYSTQDFTVDYSMAAHIYITIHPVQYNNEDEPFTGAAESRKYTIQLYTTENIIKSNFKYAKTAQGSTVIQVENIASTQEAMVVIWLTDSAPAPGAGGGVKVVGAVLVVVILLGAILLCAFFDKAKEKVAAVTSLGGGKNGAGAASSEMTQGTAAAAANNPYKILGDEEEGI